MPEDQGTSDVVVRAEEGQGRYLVAGRDFEAGDVVLSEYPVVAGPLYTRSRPVCLQCLRWVGPLSYTCTRCTFPLCSEACEAGRWHQAECRVFSEAGLKLQVEDWTSFSPVYSCISVLRTLLLKDTDPEGWRVIDSLMDHDKERAEKDSPSWKVHELLVLGFIQNTLGLKQFTQPQIRRVIGILRTNSVKLETRAGHGEGVAVYPTYSFANHSCLCNSHTRKHKDLRLELITQSPIKLGETVWTRYTTPQLGNFQRISDIQRTWHFQCTCARCEDTTEFGTMMSGLVCGGECSGILLPIRSNLIGSPWSCNTCRRKMGVLAVQGIIKAIIDDIGANREQSNSELIKLIQKYEKTVVHENHYLLIGIKEIILQRLMMRLNNRENYASLPTQEKIDALELRTKLFREIVGVLSLVDSPGSPWTQKLDKMEKDEMDLKAQLT